MWEKLMKFEYGDYDLDQSQVEVLKVQVKAMQSHLQEAVALYDGDPLSTAAGVHITGTEDQSDCAFWHEQRALRITASTLKICANNPAKVAAGLWKPKMDLGYVKAIKWGREHEEDARKEYEKKTGLAVQCCGLFVSRQNAVFAASPDGLILSQKGLLEIKCPFSLRDDDLLTVESKKFVSSFFTRSGQKLKLKKGHAYFSQVQLGMHVTGCPFAHFVI
jgi:hypothetical protein